MDKASGKVFRKAIFWVAAPRRLESPAWGESTLPSSPAERKSLSGLFGAGAPAFLLLCYCCVVFVLFSRFKRGLEKAFFAVMGLENGFFLMLGFWGGLARLGGVRKLLSRFVCKLGLGLMFVLLRLSSKTGVCWGKGGYG